MLRKAREYIFVRETVRACVRSVCEKTSRKRREEKGGGWQFGGGRRKKQARREEEEREKKRKRKKDHQPKPAKSPNRLLLSVGLNQKVFSLAHMRAGNEDLQLFCNPAACR